MLFISPLKLFFFLRYLNFCPKFSGNVEKQLDKRAKIIFKIYDVRNWDIIIATHIFQYLTKVS